tara:strand:- start:222 stop:884 length:663 start_codon:yes stop_codon:yes gene_type:complete
MYIDSIFKTYTTKYSENKYFAEYYNSLSSLIYIIVGLVSLYYYRNYDIFIKQGWIALIVVGITSFLFHKTLDYRYELLDEISMMILIYTFIIGKTGYYNRYMQKYVSTKFNILLLLIIIGNIFFYILYKKYTIFKYGFILLIILNLILCISVNTSNFSIQKYVLFGNSTIIFAKIIWEQEQKMRDSQLSSLLHSVWHLLSCVAAYFAIKHNIALRDNYNN